MEKLKALELKTPRRLNTRSVVLTGMLAATLTVGKLALSLVPNVEVVTLFILVYATVFGKRIAVPSTLVFCTVEVLLYGFNTWVALYFVYWSSLALASSFALKKPKLWLAVILAAVGTFLFGVLDAAFTTLFAAVGGVEPYQLLNLFCAYYLQGSYFIIVHIVSNVAVVGALYLPLAKAVKRLNDGSQYLTVR